jgi:hypothetical protein
MDDQQWGGDSSLHWSRSGPKDVAYDDDDEEDGGEDSLLSDEVGR